MFQINLKLTLFALFMIGHGFHAAAYQRIASLAPHLTEWVYLLERGQDVIAVSAYSNFPEAAQAKPQVSDVNGINLDKLLRLKPDAVLLWASASNPAQIRKLRSLSIPVFISDPKKLTDIGKEIERLGAFLDEQTKAKYIASSFEQQLTTLKNKYRNREPVRAFYQLWHAPITTANGDSWIQSVLDVCNIQNVFAHHPLPYPTVNKEHVIEKNPDWIIFGSHLHPQALTRSWQKLTFISAIQKGNFVFLNPDHISRHTPRVLQSISKLCQMKSKV